MRVLDIDTNTIVLLLVAILNGVTLYYAHRTEKNTNSLHIRESQKMNKPLNSYEIFQELVRQGYVQPAEHANLSMPTLYRSVPTVTTYGTASVTTQEGAANAELERGSGGNIGG